MDRQSVVIRLELHLTDDAMSGRATDSSGTARQFTGWLGLLGAIDALVPGGPPVSADAVARGSREPGAST